MLNSTMRKEKVLSEFQTRENKIVLNVKNYPSGVYFIKLKTCTRIYISKFCKE